MHTSHKYMYACMDTHTCAMHMLDCFLSAPLISLAWTSDRAKEVLLMDCFMGTWPELCGALGRGGVKLEKQRHKPVPEGSLAWPLHSQRSL